MEAERFLYRKVELNGNFHQLFSWCTTVSSKECLASLVHELILPSSWFSSQPPPLEAQSRLMAVFSEALSALKALQILQIYQICGLNYFLPSTFLGRPFRLRTLEHCRLGHATRFWLPFLREQSDVQHWSVSELSHGH
jgi:hypothetical protein